MYNTTLYRLKVFALVAEQRGVGAAAGVLGLSQPSVSSHIRGLEALVGEPLFDRRPGRPIELTDAGRVLYNYAHETVLAAENVMDVLRDFELGRRGHVTVAASRGLVHDTLVPLLVEHRRRYPNVLVTLQSGTLAQVIHLVETGAASFGLVTTKGEAGSLRSEVVCPAPLDVVSAPGHPLAARRRVTPADVARAPFVLPYRGSTHYKLVVGLARQAGYVFSNIAFEVDDGRCMSSLVREGSALAVAVRAGIRRELAEGRLAVLALDPPLPALEIRLLARPHRRPTHAEADLADLARTSLSGGGPPAR